jgi:hypothetical protein
VTGVLATLTDLAHAGEDETAVAQAASDARLRGLVAFDAVSELLLTVR